MFYKVKNFTESATTFKETSDIKNNNSDRLKTGNINKDSTSFDFFLLLTLHFASSDFFKKGIDD